MTSLRGRLNGRVDEHRLRELLQSPLDDVPERSAPRRVLAGAGVVVGMVALFVLGVWLIGSGGEDEPAATAAAPDLSPVTAPTGDALPASVAADGTSPATTAPPATVPALEGYPATGSLVAMAATPDGRAVMFGGGLLQQASGIVSRGFPGTELWSFDFDPPGWSKLEAELPVPAGRVGATLTPLGADGELLLFGGSGDSLFFCSPVPLCSAGLLDDSWVFDSAASTWRSVPSPAAPEPRVGHAAAYDEESGVVVLFGGAKLANPTNRTGTNLGDTWAWLPEAQEWRQMEPPESPPPRSVHAMAYDPRLDLVVLWGGDSTEGGETDPDVWGYDYDADEWRRLTEGFDQPPPWYHQMAWVPELERIVVVGGWVEVVRDLGDGITATNVGPTDDVWALDAADLSMERLTPLPEPTSQVGIGVVGGHGVAVFDGGHTYLYRPFEDRWEDLTEELGGS